MRAAEHVQDAVYAPNSGPGLRTGVVLSAPSRGYPRVRAEPSPFPHPLTSRCRKPPAPGLGHRLGAHSLQHRPQVATCIPAPLSPHPGAREDAGAGGCHKTGLGTPILSRWPWQSTLEVHCTWASKRGPLTPSQPCYRGVCSLTSQKRQCSQEPQRVQHGVPSSDAR